MAQAWGLKKPFFLLARVALVVVLDKDEDRGLETAATIESAGGKALYIAIDVTKDSDWQNAS